jgi:hypothetical protein
MARWWELWSLQAENQKRLVGHLNANYRDVLKAMRGELSKETRRMEAAMDNRLAAALTAFAAQSRVGEQDGTWNRFACHYM